MAINKFQISRLTFNFSAKVAHIGIPSTHKNIVSSETTRPIVLKFHMKTPYDRLAKFCTNCTGHLSKIATTPIYGKHNFKYLLLWNQKANGLGTWYVALGMLALPDLHKDESRVTLTFFMARPNLILNAFLKCSFFYNCLDRNHNTCKKCLT